MGEPVTTNKLAIISVVLVILVPVIWFLPFQYPFRIPVVIKPLFTLSPVIIGIIARNQIRKSEGNQKGNTLALIGIIAGLIEIGFVVLAIVIFIMALPLLT